ncbi:MAG: peptidase U32 family protein [Patescibacteria group bacterium]|jgi:putative protease
MKKLELLAPAGNKLKMKTAFAYGADAVYLGIPDFSLRVRINDFDLAGVKDAVQYAHQNKKKVYVTVNIFAHNKHLKKLPAYLKQLRVMKVDALIASDPGIIALIKKAWPKAEIHLSTQANCTNLEAVKFWANQGLKRIILGREVTLAEIKEIHRAAPKVELEYFVHGAMCMAYSGRCFLSKLFVGRSANLGDCAQPCRWPYEVQKFKLKTGEHEEELELVEETHGTYLLNSKDLCLIKYLKELAAAGITSFKIEGRAKSVYYQATVVGVYRRALDLLNKKLPAVKLKAELNYLYSELETKLVQRGYTTGFLLGEKADQNIINSHNKSEWEFCGQVIAPLRSLKKINVTPGYQLIYFQVHNTVRIKEELEIIRPDYDIIKIRPLMLWNAKTGEKITEAHGGGGGQIGVLEVPVTVGKIPILTVVRRLISSRKRQ